MTMEKEFHIFNEIRIGLNNSHQLLKQYFKIATDQNTTITHCLFKQRFSQNI